MKKCCWLYANEKINTYAACFIGKTVKELIEDFNNEVGAEELTQDRAYYHEALLYAFEEKGIDVTAILEGKEIRLDQKVELDEENRRLRVVCS